MYGCKTDFRVIKMYLCIDNLMFDACKHTILRPYVSNYAYTYVCIYRCKYIYICI